MHLIIKSCSQKKKIVGLIKEGVAIEDWNVWSEVPTNLKEERTKLICE